MASAAANFTSAITELTSAPWLGPASRSMVAAVIPYVDWLGVAGTQAEQSAMQARAAAAAYETAFGMTVPPPVIATNRMLLAQLVATNFFGQNTAAIAATEAQYAEMWAQDATAMYGYAASSALASQLTPFSDPAPTTDAAGLAAQSDAVNQAAATPAGTGVSAVSQATPSAVGSTTTPNVATSTAVPQVLQTLASSASSTGTTSNEPWIVQLLGSLNTANRVALVRTAGLSYFGEGLGQFFASIAQQLVSGPGTTAGSGGAWYPTPQFAGLGLGGSHGGGAISANLASSTKIGALSAPPSWASASGAIEKSATEATAVNYVAGKGPGTTGFLNGMPLGGAGRRGSAGFTHRYGFRQTIVVRPPSAG